MPRDGNDDENGREGQLSSKLLREEKEKIESKNTSRC